MDARAVVARARLADPAFDRLEGADRRVGLFVQYRERLIQTVPPPLGQTSLQSVDGSAQVEAKPFNRFAGTQVAQQALALLEGQRSR